MRLQAALLLASLWALPSGAAVVSERPESVTVTLYHEGTVDTAELARGYFGVRDGLAFITETRTVDLPAGPATIEFRGVVSTMVPQTADIQGLPAGVPERNFEYDLLSPGSLLAKSIGEKVRLVRVDRDTGKLREQTAIVRSAPSGAALEIDGKFEALHCSGLPEKLVFEKVPDGLRDTPTLSARTDSPVAGRYTIKISYIATGLNWSADYIARIRPDRHSLDLTGWITLANFSATSFAQSPVEVVAGRLETTGADTPVFPKPLWQVSDCWPTEINWNLWASPLQRRLHDKRSGNWMYASSPVTASVETVVVSASTIEAGRLGDYKIYRLPEPTAVAAHQTKQVQFLDQHSVPFERIYTYVVGAHGDANQDEPATAVLRLQNTNVGGLGEPLPAGAVSVMENSPSGTAVLAGQDRVRDISVGLPLEIATGRAMDVRVERRITDKQSIGRDKDKRTRTTFEVEIENDKSVPVQFEFAHPLVDGLQVIAEDLPHTVKPDGLIWSFALKPGERDALHYTIEQPGA